MICGDALWMLEKLQTSKCEDDQKIWAELIEWSFNRQDVKQIDAIIAATQTNSVLQELFSPYFVPIELNSSQADKQRNDYVRIRKMQAHRQNPPLLKPPFKERIQQLLMKLESGDLSAWWQLDKLMTLNPESQYQNNLKLDLTQLPGWQDAEEATQRRIIEGAKKYVQEQDDVDYDL